MIVTKLNVNKVVKTLKEGKIVLVPTETVFGVAVIYNNQSAFNKLMKLKNRPSDKHFPICVGNVDQINMVADFNKDLVNKLLPDSLTLILKSKNLPKYMKCDTVAIRYPNDKFLNKVVNKLGKPILLTSANLSGQEPIKNIFEATKLFKDKVSCYVIGKTKIGTPSTIVKIVKNKVEILREGPISKKEIEKKLEVK